MERSKVQPDDYGRYLWLSGFLLEFFLSYRKSTNIEDLEIFDFDVVSGVMGVRNFLFVVKRIRTAIEEKVTINTAVIVFNNLPNVSNFVMLIIESIR